MQLCAGSLSAILHPSAATLAWPCGGTTYLREAPDTDGGGGVEYNSRGVPLDFFFFQSRRQQFIGALFDLQLYLFYSIATCLLLAFQN